MITDYFIPVPPDTPGAFLHNGQSYKLDPLTVGDLFIMLEESRDLEAARAERDEWKDKAGRLDAAITDITKKLESIQNEADSLRNYIDDLEGV